MFVHTLASRWDDRLGTNVDPHENVARENLFDTSKDVVTSQISLKIMFIPTTLILS